MTIVKVDQTKLQNDYDGFELYYDKENRVLYSSIRAVARWVDCSPKTVLAFSTKLKVGQVAEVLTGGGLQGVTLFTSAEVIGILDKLATNNRVKKQTRENAQARITLLATLGNELGGMLLVAPEELAKRAIDRTTSIEQLAEVQEHSETHLAYLREFHGLKEELAAHGAKGIHHATVNKYNNKLVGIPDGGRPDMTDDEKDSMTLLQLVEKMKLKKKVTQTAWHAANYCKMIGRETIAFISGKENPELNQG